MKESVRKYLATRFKGMKWNEDSPEEQVDPLAHWPDIGVCVESYYDSHPELKEHCPGARPRVKLRSTERFLKSLDRYCTTRSLRLRLIDALTKKVYGIPCPGLRDAPIKERAGLWHFYISASWRVFYRKVDNHVLLEEFCPHKKVLYYRRPRAGH